MTTPYDQLDAKTQEVIDAFRSLRKQEIQDGLPGVEQAGRVVDLGTRVIFGSDIPDARTRIESEDWKPRIWEAVEPFTHATWGEGVESLRDLLALAEHEIGGNSPVDADGPLANIEDRTTGWEGPVADAFRRHVRHLTPALQYQHEFALSLREVISAHGEIVKKGFSLAKEMLQAAADTMNGEAERLRQAAVDELGELVGDAIDASLASAEGPGEVAKTALGKVGEAVADISFVPSGTAQETMEDLQRSLGRLCTAIEEEQRQIRTTLDDLSEYLTGYARDDFLPLPINQVDTGLGVGSGGSSGTPRGGQ